MSTEHVRLGDPALVFGIPDVEWGWLTDVTDETAPSKAECPNGQGDVVAVEYYRNGQKTVSGNFYFRKGKNTPASLVGTATPIRFTQIVDQEDAPAGDYYVDSVTKQYSNSDFVKISFKATHYPHLVFS